MVSLKGAGAGGSRHFYSHKELHWTRSRVIEATVSRRECTTVFHGGSVDGSKAFDSISRMSFPRGVSFIAYNIARWKSSS